MKLIKILSSFILVFLVYSCADYQTSKIDNKPTKQYYSSSGFALVYEDHLYDEKVVNRKFNNESLLVRAFM